MFSIVVMDRGFLLDLNGQGPLGRTTLDKNKNTVKRWGKTCKRRENILLFPLLLSSVVLFFATAIAEPAERFNYGDLGKSSNL